MALSKTTGNVLKVGASAAGVGLMFTPVGAACGLSGLAAAGVDMAAAPVTGFIGDKVSGGLKHLINDHTQKDKPKESHVKSNNSDTKEKQEMKDKSSDDNGKNKKFSDDSHKLHPIKDVAKVGAGAGGGLAITKLLANHSQNSQGRSTGQMTNKFMSGLTNMSKDKSQQKSLDADMQRLGLDQNASSAQQQAQL